MTDNPYPHIVGGTVRLSYNDDENNRYVFFEDFINQQVEYIWSIAHSGAFRRHKDSYWLVLK